MTGSIICVAALEESFDKVSNHHLTDTFQLRLRQILILYMHLIVDIKIKLVGWFIEIVEL